MADYEHLPASNGSGDAALMHIQSDRTAGATLIDVDTVTNVPTKFIGTWGTLGADGKITLASKRDFRGHVSGADLIIDAMCPGNTDGGNTIGQVVIIKPNTRWSDLVAQFIKNATGWGTPENSFWSTITAAIATITGNTTIGGSLSVTGNTTLTGTSRLVPTGITSASTITPASQIYNVTALAVPATLAVPSFTAADGQTVIVRIRDNGTGRALTFAAGYIDVTGIGLPTTTVANKLLTIGAMYNSANSKWEIQAISQEA